MSSPDGEHGRVRHHDWIYGEDGAAESLHRTVKMYERGGMPQSIEVFMLVTPIRRLLRGIYGSNFRAAFALLYLAVRSALLDLVPRWYWRWYDRNEPDLGDPGDAGLAEEVDAMLAEEGE